MACGNKPKYNCGSLKSNSRCVFYDKDIPEFSKLDDEDCITVEETIDDIYSLVSLLKESVDLSDLELDSNCLQVDKVKSKYNKKEKVYLVKDIIKALVEKTCGTDSSSASGSSSNSNSFNVANALANVDYKCLIDKCGARPSNLTQFFQLIIDNICK